MSGGLSARHPSLRAFKYRDFRLLLAGSLITGMAMPLLFLTQVFWVQAEYPGHTVLYASLIAGARGLGMLIFSLLGGAIADRFERRRVLLVCSILALAINAVVAALMLVQPGGGDPTIVAVTVCSFLASGVMSVDMPARNAAVPAVVGREDMGNAISLNMVAMQITLPLSFPIIGFVNGTFEAGQVYAGSLVLWAAIIPLIAALRFRSIGGADARAGMLKSIGEGLSYTRGHATILAVILLVVVIQCIGMPAVANPLGPIWMTEILGLSKQQFGFMAMTWGIGAMVASLFFTRFDQFPLRGATLCALVVAFGVNVLVFGYSRSVPLTAVANFALGFAFAGVLLVSATLVQHLVAEEMRGRVMGLFPLTLGLAQLNTAPVGAAAQEFGLTFIVPALGWVSLALAGTVIVGLRGVVGTRVAHHPADVPVATVAPAAGGR
jgi:MFS family permease